MRTIEHLRDYLLENYVDEYGDLDIRWLDFSEFDGDVYTGGMKVKGSLFQSHQEVQGYLWQGNHKAQSDLYQSRQEVKGVLFQDKQKVQGNYYCIDVQVSGNIFADEPTKLLKEITVEELAKFGYTLKGDK